jgi:hypothetical protein
MYKSEYLPAIIVSALCLYALLRIKVGKAMQPKRLELARVGRDALSNPLINDEYKEYINFLLDHAFGVGWFLIFEIVSIPFISAIIVLRMSWIRKMMLFSGIEDQTAIEQIERIERLFYEISWANNPFLMIIVEVEMAVFISIAILLRVSLLSLIPNLEVPEIKRDVISGILERVLGRFFRSGQSGFGSAA